MTTTFFRQIFDGLTACTYKIVYLGLQSQYLRQSKCHTERYCGGDVPKVFDCGQLPKFGEPLMHRTHRRCGNVMATGEQRFLDMNSFPALIRNPSNKVFFGCNTTIHGVKYDVYIKEQHGKLLVRANSHRQTSYRGFTSMLCIKRQERDELWK